MSEASVTVTDPTQFDDHASAFRFRVRTWMQRAIAQDYRPGAVEMLADSHRSEAESLADAGFLDLDDAMETVDELERKVVDVVGGGDE